MTEADIPHRPGSEEVDRSDWLKKTAGKFGSSGYIRFVPSGDYEMVRDAILDAFNPPDTDAAEEAVLVDAVNLAASFISLQPCECTDVACVRCQCLGEFHEGARRD